MTLDLAALRLLAWQNPPFDPCSTCGQTPNHRCRTSSDALCPPHKSRMDQATGWDRRQPEVDELQQGIDRRDSVISAANDSLRTAAENAATLTDQLKTARLGAALVPGLQQQVADLLAKIAELTKPVPEPEPTLVTKFGACPAKGGESAAAAATVTAKFGKGAAVRQFLSTGVAPRPADASIVHVSWKPTAAQITDDWVTKVTANLLAGDCVEVFHESDSKVRKGDYTKADLVARKNAFFDAVKRVRPDLLVVNTLTGWVMDPGSKLDPEEWAVVKADVLGVDCDGIHPTKLPYTDYTAETKAALAWLAKYPGYRFFAVPEFGCPLITSVDPDGAHRAAYHDQYAALWRSTGKCLFVTLFDYDTIGYTLTTPAEISGWKGNVAS